MDKRIFDVKPEFGITEYWYYDPITDTAYIEAVQDVEPALELNKALFADTDERAPWKDGMQKVATIPIVILQDLEQRGILKDKRKFRAWLNDPENRHFRTRPGKV